MIRTSISIAGQRQSDHDFTHVSISQQVGGHHTFDIRMKMDAKKSILMDKTKAWIGQTVSIGLDHHKDMDLIAMPVKEVFKGIVTSIELSRKRGAGEIVVKGHSPTIVMDDGPHTQSFTETGLKEAVDKIIRPYASAFPESPKLDPTRKTAVIDYTVQYKESNFKFLNRLANRYGEWFYYDGLDLYFGKRGEKEAIPLDFGENGLNFFDMAVEALPTQIEMKAYDYRKHEAISEKTPAAISSNEVANTAFDLASSKIFSNEPAINLQTDIDSAELKEVVKRREEIAADEMVIFSGVSVNCGICPGAVIHVEDKELGQDYGKYIITRCSHNIGQGGDYSNNFEAVPEEFGLPPLNAMPEPPFCETQIGTVKDTNDSDSMGRIKVEMLWQQGSGETTPWIRVATPYMGKDKGFYMIPEVDDQVLVAFENNNPDKPYVLTGLYHGEDKPEWFDAKNRYKGFKSKGQNQWKFDDKEEAILLSAPKEMTLHAGKKIILKTDGEEESEIHVNVGEGTVSIVAKHVNVDAAETVVINSDKEITTMSKEKTSILSNDTIEVDAKKKLEMASAEIKAEGKQKTEVAGAQVDVKGQASVKVKATLIELN